MLRINNISHSALTKPATALLLASAVNFATMTHSFANEINTKQYSISQGQFSSSLNNEQRNVIIETNKLTKIPDQLNGKASTKTRADILNEQQSSKKAAKSTTPQSKNAQITTQDYFADFALYGATSLVQDDLDGDGFYQTLSVTFDADIFSYTANPFGEVYALLYVSKNGGPWTHYFTTDDFVIESDSELDEYEVITTFLSGYSTDHYDVLIDLYQVGYSDIVASLSSDDSNALYALSLESAEYDEPYVETYIEVVETGGSIYWLILCLVAACRRLTTNNL